MITYSEAQALAFITDPGTLKRGQELLKPAKWSNLGRTETAAWGDCAGSGSKPYRTGIDLTEPAFKCSCPSRVFPCKHGAGLLLLMARQPELFGSNTPPAWLEEWLEKRQQTQEKKAEKPVAKASKAATVAERPAAEANLGASISGEAAAAENVAEALLQTPTTPAVDPRRLARMVAGAEDLVAWLEDLMRAGLATLDKQPTNYWESQAARLVDNQLPGLAATLRELAT
ncbi:SWIM zinc finger family protein, partial [Hymenobacter agri]